MKVKQLAEDLANLTEEEVLELKSVLENDYAKIIAVWHKDTDGSLLALDGKFCPKGFVWDDDQQRCVADIG